MVGGEHKVEAEVAKKISQKIFQMSSPHKLRGKIRFHAGKHRFLRAVNHAQRNFPELHSIGSIPSYSAS